MIQIICGEKGSGKTKVLLEKANEAVKASNGQVVYLDKSTKQMYELDKQIRLINVSEYPVNSYEAFIGFVAGLLSGNHDIDTVLCDSFLKVAHLDDGADLAYTLIMLEKASERINFIISLSINESLIPDTLKDKVVFP